MKSLFYSKIAIAILLVTLQGQLTCSARSQSPEVLSAISSAQSLMQQGDRSLDAGKQPEAEELFKRAVADLEKLNNKAASPVLSSIYDRLANLYNIQAKYAEAERCFKSALALKEYDSATVKSDLILNLTNIGTVLKNASKYTAAEEYYEKALQLTEKTSKVEDPLVAAAAAELADAYCAGGKFELAEKGFKRVLAIYEKSLPPESAQIADTLSSMGRVYSEQGLYRQAEPFCLKSLSIRQKLYGDDNSIVARTKANLATIYGKLGKISEAARIMKEALETTEKLDGPSSRTVGSLAKNLGSIYAEQGRYIDAEKLLKRSLVITEAKMGPEHPEVATPLQTLGILYQLQGKYAEAEETMRRALAICEKSVGPDHPLTAKTLDSLGSLYADENKLEQSEQLLSRAAKIYSSHGGENPNLARVLESQSRLKQKQGKYDEAEKFSRRAMSIWKVAYGEQHYLYRNAARDLSQMLSTAGKPTEAIVEIKEALRLDEEVTGPQSGTAASDLIRLSRIYQQAGNEDLAQETRRRADLIMKKIPGAPVTPENKTRAPSIAGTPSNKWALVVGVSNFKDPSINLRYSAKDATDFGNYLVQSGNFPREHVRVLTDQNATRQGIFDTLGEDLAKKIGKNDLLLVYFSSHGGKPPGNSAGVNFLVPYDGNFRNLLTSGIPMEWLTEIIKDQIPCSRVVLILDVCHSGAAATGGEGENDVQIASNSASSAESKDLIYKKLAFDAGKVTTSAGQFVLCSSQANQQSWESKNYQNSVFTHWLIEGLKTKGPSTTLGDAYDFMKQRVEDEVLRDRGAQQTPLIKKSWQGEELRVGAP